MNTDGAFCDQAQDFPVGLPGGFTHPQLQSKGKWGGQKTGVNQLRTNDKNHTKTKQNKTTTTTKNPGEPVCPWNVYEEWVHGTKRQRRQK